MKYSVPRIFSFCCVTLFFTSLESSFAQGPAASQIGRDESKAITTAVPILLQSPDARSAALGEAGVAISPDVNAGHWNPGKLGFITTDISAGLSISPWLTNIGINDMYLTYLSFQKKVNKRSAFSASLTYFDLGDMQFIDENQNPIGNFSPKEYALDVSYGQQLSEHLGVGIGARFIHSNLSGGVTDSKVLIVTGILFC